MEFVSFEQPARIWKQAEDTIAELGFPSKIRIQITGPGAETVFESGPADGETWSNVLLRVEARVES